MHIVFEPTFTESLKDLLNIFISVNIKPVYCIGYQVLVLMKVLSVVNPFGGHCQSGYYNIVCLRPLKE